MILAMYGAHGLAQEVYIIAKKINKELKCWDDFVFIDDVNAIESVQEKKVYKFKELMEQYNKEDVEIVVSVGEPSVREMMFNKIRQSGYKLATLIHPGVYIDETTKIGEGTVICEGVTITCNVSIGKNVYIHPHAVIGHDIRIGDHSAIGSGCVIGGNNIVGNRVYFGSLAGTKEKLKIGDDVICSAGAMVFRDLRDEVIAVGNPARIMKTNDEKKVFKK